MPVITELLQPVKLALSSGLNFRAGHNRTITACETGPIKQPEFCPRWTLSNCHTLWNWPYQAVWISMPDITELSQPVKLALSMHALQHRPRPDVILISSASHTWMTRSGLKKINRNAYARHSRICRHRSLCRRSFCRRILSYQRATETKDQQQADNTLIKRKEAYRIEETWTDGIRRQTGWPL